MANTETGIQHLLTDTKPIYLGFDPIKEKYYFYIIKNQVPRFLVYTNYFFLDRGPQDILELRQVPENVVVELHQYLTQKVRYELVKRRKNSKTFDPVRIFNTPGPYEEPPSPIEVHGSTSCRLQPDGLDGGVPRTEPVRRTRKPRRGTPSQSVHVEESTPKAEIQTKIQPKVETELVVEIPTPVETPLKRRGRPPKLKPVIESESNVKDETAVPASKVKRRSPGI